MKHITEPELTQATEMMAETVHNYWMEKRKKEKGWHAPGECPGRESIISLVTGKKGFEKGEESRCADCHPCMLPYKDLPDSEKELDRLYPTVFLSLLKDMGFMVVKPMTTKLHKIRRIQGKCDYLQIKFGGDPEHSIYLKAEYPKTMVNRLKVWLFTKLSPFSVHKWGRDTKVQLIVSREEEVASISNRSDWVVKP